MRTVIPSAIRPGDVITHPSGPDRIMETKVVHAVHAHSDGSVSLRTRFASNPRSIDWNTFVSADETEVVLVSHGAVVDDNLRTLLS